MKLFIKGKGITEWQEDLSLESNYRHPKHIIDIIVKYYINLGYDVKIEQRKGITK